MSPRLVAVTLAAVVLVAAGCTSSATKSAPPRAFCQAASNYEGELDHEQTVGKIDVAKQISDVSQMAADAPAAIKTDAETFLHALQDVGHDPRLKNNPKVKQAVDNVNRFASNKCGLFDLPPD